MTADPLSVIRGLIDRRSERVSIARDAVNVPMIHHLCDAVGDRDPRCLDREAARAAGYPDVIAPASSLQVWNMANPGEARTASDVEAAYAALADGGYSAVVAVNCDQEYDRALVPGDLLTAHERIESVAGPKRTGLGEGFFLTTLTRYTDQHGEQVGTMRFRTLWYRPGPQADRTEDR